MNENVTAYWNQFLATLPADSPYHTRPYDAEGWGDSPEMAEDLGHLIAKGTKTATCSSVWEWQHEGQEWTKPGHITVVLDGSNNPLCIIEVTEVMVKPYNQVDAQFAYDEGEGDRSLDYWRAAHRRYFGRTLKRIGLEFSEDMPLVCERFKVIYK